MTYRLCVKCHRMSQQVVIDGPTVCVQCWNGQQTTGFMVRVPSDLPLTVLNLDEAVAEIIERRVQHIVAVTWLSTPDFDPL